MTKGPLQNSEARFLNKSLDADGVRVVNTRVQDAAAFATAGLPVAQEALASRALRSVADSGLFGFDVACLGVPAPERADRRGLVGTQSEPAVAHMHGLELGMAFGGRCAAQLREGVRHQELLGGQVATCADGGAALAARAATESGGSCPDGHASSGREAACQGQGREGII